VDMARVLRLAADARTAVMRRARFSVNLIG
jgi:hypothetical protein